LASATVTLKTCELPLPEAGLTEVIDGGWLAISITQLPMVCQPVLTPERFAASAYKCWEPPNPLLKLSEKLAVRLTPDVVKEEPAALSVHRLLDTVAALPATIGASQAVPASLASRIWPTERLYIA